MSHAITKVLEFISIASLFYCSVFLKADLKQNIFFSGDLEHDASL